MRYATVATLTRGEFWNDGDATEPYEAGWAGEAMIFARGLIPGGVEGVAHVQVSPDGIRWCDEGTVLKLLPGEDLSFAKIREFGHFLRLRIVLPKGESRQMLATIALKA